MATLILVFQVGKSIHFQSYKNAPPKYPSYIRSSSLFFVRSPSIVFMGSPYESYKHKIWGSSDKIHQMILRSCGLTCHTIRCEGLLTHVRCVDLLTENIRRSSDLMGQPCHTIRYGPLLIKFIRRSSDLSCISMIIYYQMWGSPYTCQMCASPYRKQKTSDLSYISEDLLTENVTGSSDLVD